MRKPSRSGLPSMLLNPIGPNLCTPVYPHMYINYKYTYICIYPSIYIYAHVDIYMSMSACIYIYTHIYTYIHISVYTVGRLPAFFNGPLHSTAPNV